MHSTLIQSAAVLLAAGMASAQTFTDCNPLEKSKLTLLIPHESPLTRYSLSRRPWYGFRYQL